MRQLARNFPNLQGETGQLDSTQAGDMYSYSLDDDEDDMDVSMGILPIHPIVEKDKQILELNKTVESLKAKLMD